MIKHYPSGKVSSHMHSLTPGDKVYFSGPWVTYRWEANAFRHVALIAGGAGITPLFQLTQGILKNPGDKTKITLVVGNRSPADVFLKEELEKLEQESNGRLRVVHTVGEGDGKDEQEAKKKGLRSGKISKALLGELLPKEEFGRDAKILVCGPPGMVDALAGKITWIGSRDGGILKELGYEKQSVHIF